MKKLFLLFVFAITMSINLYSQNVITLANAILKQNDFTLSKNLLSKNGFTLFSAQELEAFGRNSNVIIIGTKGTNPSNSLMATITAMSQTNHEIKEATIICSKANAMNLESDLINAGYQKKSEREYIEGGRFQIKEKIYKSIIGKSTNTATVKISKDGSVQMIFKSTRTIK